MATYDQYAVISRYGRKPPSEKDGLAYLKAVKIIVGADGEIAEGEQKALRAGMRRLGLAKDLCQQLEDFDFKAHKLEEVLPQMKKGGLRAKMLLRDAIEISSADGHYADAEREAVKKTADLLGVDQQTVQMIEALVELERGARHLRKALFPKKD